MKNKRYKREAKRLIGHCLSVGKCSKCEHYKIVQDWDEEEVYDCSAPSFLPSLTGIRGVEKELKRDSDKRLEYRKKKRKSIF